MGPSGQLNGKDKEGAHKEEVRVVRIYAEWDLSSSILIFILVRFDCQQHFKILFLFIIDT